MTKIVDIPREYWPDIGELPGDLSRIAEAIEEQLPGQGVFITLLLAQIFPGQPLYIRDIKYLIRRMRDDAIRGEYDSTDTTMLRLATSYKLSHARIKQILAQPGSQKEMEEKQIRMW